MAGDRRLDPAVERRATRRFGIQQEVTYKTFEPRNAQPETGGGLTLNFSSRGILFQTSQPLKSGKRVEVSVNWPALISGTCPLKFVALGHVVRVEEDRVAVSIEQYQFRTRRTRELSLPA